jgi:RNA polymerase sigma-70 factor (ECF subfamily)
MIRSGLDRAFVRYARTGEPRALARVFDGSAVELYRLGYHLLGDRHAAEDLVQQTFVVAIEQAKSFERGRAVLPWLCGILTNRALHLRRQARLREAQGGRVVDVVVDPVAEVAAREVSDTVADAVRSLPEPYRQVLLLHLVHELTPKEVAEALARPDATVRTQLARGLDLLRKALPVGIAGLAMGCVPVPIGLSAVRAAVLARAGAEVAVGAVSVATFAGVVAMKKVLLAVVVVLAVLGSWPWWSGDQVPPANVDTGAKAVSVATASSRVPSAEPDRSGTDIRVAVPAPDAARTAALDVAVLWHDGTPAVDVAVRCRPLPLDVELWLRAARTDGNGVAHFEGLLPGMANAKTHGASSSDVELKAGATEKATLTIPSGIDVHGRVVDLDERPIAGATVWMSVTRCSDDSEPVAVTGPDGVFAIRSSGPEHVVSATAPGFGCAKVAFIRAEHAEKELVLVLRPAPGVLVGTVLDPAGLPVADARVLVGITSSDSRNGEHQRIFGETSGQDCWPSRFLRSDAGGRFRVEGLPLWRWPVWVGAPGFAPAWQEVQLLAGTETRVTITLTHGATLHGRVTDATGCPVAAAGVYGYAKLPQAHELISLGCGFGDSGQLAPLWASISTKTGVDGRYQIDNVLPARLRLHVSHRNGQAKTECEVIDGQTFVWDAVIVAESRRPLHGMLVDAQGNPLDGWEMRVDDLGNAENPGWMWIGKGGVFRTNPVSDGVHRLFVQPRAPMVGAEVDVGEFDVANCPLRLVVPREHVPTGSLRGRIVADGQPASRSYVELTHHDLGKSVTVEPDAEWRFVAEPLQRGTYTVRVDSPAFGRIDVGHFEVADGQVTDIGEFKVPTPGVLVVTIVDAAGQRLPDGWVMARAIGDNANRGGNLEHLEGVARGNLPAGRWLLTSVDLVPLAAMEVEVRAGETTEVRFVVPDSVPFVLRVPAGAREFGRMLYTWRDATGSLLRSCSVYENEAGTDVQRSAPPGRYTLEVVGSGGRKASKTFDLRASTPPQVVELPLPDR